MPTVQKLYYLSCQSASLEDCYDWLITAVLFALQTKAWRNPDSKIYGDLNGPDKIINRCIKNERANFYQACNRKKRVINFECDSLEKMEEESNIQLESATLADETSFSNTYSEIISYYFRKKEYFTAFMLDGIINGDVFKLEEGQEKYSEKKLIQHLKHLDDRYCAIFSDIHNLDYDLVKKASLYVTSMSRDTMKTRYQQSISILQKVLS